MEDEPEGCLASPNEVLQCGYGHRRAMISLEIRQAKFK